MKAIILLGGLGTRLRPFTLQMPKPLLPVVNRPFLSYQLDQLKRHGIREVVLALGYRAAHFRRRLGDGRRWNMRFVYSLETTPLGTGGAIRKAFAHVSGPTFILNGDILSDLDLSRLHRLHRLKKSGATLALKEVEDPSLFGLIETGTDGRIWRFVEKPAPGEATTNTVNAGYYLFEPEIFDRIPPRRALSVERDVFPQLVQAGIPMYGYLHKGYWIDIGTLRSYWKVHRDFLGERQVLNTEKRREVRKGIWAAPDCRIGKNVVGKNVVLGEYCRIGDDVVFEGQVCLGPHCIVENKTFLSDCVVHENTHIRAVTRVEKALIGSDCRIGPNAQIGPAAVIANRSVLGPYTQWTSGSWEESRD